MFKVGDKVEIVDRGERYSTYREWIKRHSPEYLEEYVAEGSICNGDEGVILVVAEHKSGFPLYLVQLEDAVCLVNERAIKLIDRPSEVSQEDIRLKQVDAIQEELDILRAMVDRLQLIMIYDMVDSLDGRNCK